MHAHERCPAARLRGHVVEQPTEALKSVETEKTRVAQPTRVEETYDGGFQVLVVEREAVHDVVRSDVWQETELDGCRKKSVMSYKRVAVVVDDKRDDQRAARNQRRSECVLGSTVGLISFVESVIWRLPHDLFEVAETGGLRVFRLERIERV